MKFKLIEDINRGHEDVSSKDLLNEQILTEATVPCYRDILFDLIFHLTNNDKLKELILNNKQSLELHHIDSDYDKISVVLRKATNNSYKNIAVVTKDAHIMLKNLNTEFKHMDRETAKQHKINKFYSIIDDYSDEIFPLERCIPQEFINSINNLVTR